ncbi:hypothetical protein CC78DRAFT_149644 [Lojkania enalia]|uniref:Transmembrane protein n=1 Tax=Lojkania enalia TaxID=147567 RepID=A0A9P4KER5_9PLEO|nr:hypothetical protein CC78DRAFT_149644 [Didymosphaeria enalia]
MRHSFKDLGNDPTCFFGPSSNPSIKTLICTIIILKFTIILEVIVNVQFEKLPNHTDSSKPNEKLRCCNPNPPPLTRATRLVVATFLLISICIAFGIRIYDANTPYYYCYGSIDPPNWTAIVFLNIIPFFSACMSWLRALVSCILGRYGMGLDYKKWPPCFPLYPFIALGWFIWESAVRWMEMEKKVQNDDIEMNVGVNEETRALVGEAEDTEDDTETLFSPESLQRSEGWKSQEMLFSDPVPSS